MRILLGCVLALLPFYAQATERWDFTHKVGLGSAPVDGVFHHLEGSGRKHIAVSGNQVGVVWEDNSSGDPQVYLALKPVSQNQFGPAIKLSQGQEAFEPAIAAIPGERFVVVYEQDSAVYVRLKTLDGLSDSIKLSSSSAAHASIASYADQLAVIWREKNQQGYSLLVSRLRVGKDNHLLIGAIHQVEPDPLPEPVLMPGISLNESSLCVVWEDRRAGHTRLLYSYSDLADIKFSEPISLNEFYSNRNEYDKGNGVTRVAIAGLGSDEVLASWMDKRLGGKGYAIYAAFGSAADESFGPNERVQGNDGSELPHYNPAVAGNWAGDFVIAWDDNRRGDSDIWLSSYNENSEWSEDYSPTVTSGAGEQTQASLALDEAGGLHMVWVERGATQSPSRLWYGYAKQQD